MIEKQNKMGAFRCSSYQKEYYFITDLHDILFTTTLYTDIGRWGMLFVQ